MNPVKQLSRKTGSSKSSCLASVYLSILLRSHQSYGGAVGNRVAQIISPFSSTYQHPPACVCSCAPWRPVH